MSGCLRRVSLSLSLPYKAVPVAVAGRAQEILCTRYLSNGNTSYSVACVALRNDNKVNTEVMLQRKVDNYIEAPHIHCQIKLNSTEDQHNTVDSKTKSKIDDVFNRYGVCLNGEALMKCTNDSSVVAWNKLYAGDLLMKAACVDAENNAALNNKEYLPHTVYTCERLPIVNSYELYSSSALHEDGKLHYSPATDNKSESGRPNRASPEQLQHISKKLAEYLPQLFVNIMDYTIYDQNLKFTNNIRGGTTTVGLYHYIKQVAFLRFVGHFRFSHVKLHILNMAIRQENSTVVVRWRIAGISGLRVFVMFWKYKLWKVRQIVNEAETWYDGVSTFYVGPDGLIKEHIADKITPDDSNAVDEIVKSPIATKLALLVGLVPKPSLGSMQPIFDAINNMKKSTDGCLSDAHLPLDKIKT